jgi:hypothetical protein
MGLGKAEFKAKVTNVLRHAVLLLGGYGERLAVAIVVMPPAAVSVTKKSATNANVVVGLDFSQAFSVVHSGRTHGHFTLGNLVTGGLGTLRKHRCSFFTGNRILLEYAIGNVINANLVALTGR